MIKQTVYAVSALSLIAALLAPPAEAQGAMNSQGATGTFGNTSRRTNNARRPNSFFTTGQRLNSVRAAGLGGLAEIHGGGGGRNGLPPTSLDSFVLNAGGSAEQIYGDEGTELPPYFEFTTGHRIERGITGQRASGLTTGHGSMMPGAWGGDEFCKGTDWSMSGNRSNGQTWSQPPQNGSNPGTPAAPIDDGQPWQGGGGNGGNGNGNNPPPIQISADPNDSGF